MAFVAFRTWVTGEVVTAAQLNEQIRDNGNAIIKTGWNVVFENGGAVITTDTYHDVHVPAKCDITGVYAFADQTGSITVDIWRVAGSDQPAADSDSIAASAPIAISSDVYYEDTTLTGWTKTLAEDNVLRYYVEANASITKCTISTKVNRS